MTTEEEARVEEAGSQAIAALVDALTPLVSPGGLVGVATIALVRLGGDVLFPVRLVLGVDGETVATVLQAQADHRMLPLSEGDQFVIPMPVKQ